MRVKKMPALAFVVAAAGLSLTACGSSGGSGASAGTTASTTASSSTDASGSTTGGTSTGGQGSTSGSSSSGSTGGQGSTSGSSGSGKAGGTAAQAQTSTSSSMCKTDHLAFSASASGTKNEIVVNLKNTGSGKCSMHGFPGVQLVGPDGLGDTGPDAARTDASAATVTIGPGEETRFLLRYIPDTSGSGKKYTRLDVTPPNEKVSEIVNLNGLAFTISASSGNAPDVYVDPVGYHVGSGK
ncbi:DUF4232 domain-containing protein [Streptomyces sp. NRRL S-646]|uniref:DUF4232 domain-containing protein n=1 Tax=Streptomyces sp. NRRL S-646 TaxID=1463917 RepID=UPI0004C61A80|nr:DUF4232 domain-containing protein [Streptomyces sp. NRRL S-646]